MNRVIALTALALALSVPAAASAASPLKGVYSAKVTGKSAQLNGTWLLSFAPNGAYAVVKEPDTSTLLIGGSSTTSGSVLTLVDRTGPLACTGRSATSCGACRRSPLSVWHACDPQSETAARARTDSLAH